MSNIPLCQILFFHINICACLHNMFGYVFIKFELYYTHSFHNMLFPPLGISYNLSLCQQIQICTRASH